MNRIIERFLHLFLLIFLVECGKLSYEENKKRLLDCGKQMPHQKNETFSSFRLKSDSWLVHVMLVKNDSIIHSDFTMGSFISPRHILTSSQVVMDDHKNWILNNEQFKDEEFLSGTANVLVPLNTTKVWKLEVEVKKSKAFKYFSVEKAWLVSVNHGHDENYRMRALMLIELKEASKKVKFPCLAEKDTEVNIGDTVDIFGQNANRSSTLVDHRKEKVVRFPDDDARWILVPRYDVALDRGGPMIDYKNNIVTIWGVAASPPYIGGDETWFFDMREVAERVCDLSGICKAPPNTTTTVEPTTTPDPMVTLANNATTEDPSVSGAPNNETLATTRRTGTRSRVPATTVSEVYDEDGYDDYPDLNRIEDAYEENGHQHTKLYFLVSMVLVLVLVLF